MNKLFIGMKAPDFEANTTQGIKKLSDYKGKWLILFSHPADFTPVCTTEMISLARANDHFKERNAELLGLSIDGNFSHLAWINNIFLTTGVEIPFPIIADVGSKISSIYGMIPENKIDTSTVRDVFFIDEEGIIRAILSYPKTNGRYIPEILRLLDALQITDKENVVTPANWMPGQPVIIPPPNNYNELKERIDNKQGLQCVDWYLCFKNEEQ